MTYRKSHDNFNRNEFVLHYQPIINVYREKIVGVEALVRWQHPHRGLLFPKDFLPLAEATDLILKLDQWVLRTACTQVRRWQSEGYPLFLAVNFSTSSFTQNHLWRRVVNLLDECHFDPRMLKIELTNHSLLHHREEAIVTMKELKTIDVEWVLDDFNLEHSAAHFLRDFPFDILKIHGNSTRANDVKPLIEIAHSIGKKVIGESVETEEEKLTLRQSKCHLMQGHLWCPALPSDQLSHILQNPHSLSSLTESPWLMAS